MLNDLIRQLKCLFGYHEPETFETYKCAVFCKHCESYEFDDSKLNKKK